MSRDTLQEKQETGFDTSVVDEILKERGRNPEDLISILQGIQHHYRYLPLQAMEHVAQVTDITAAQIEGVSTFYSQFRLRPAGEHTIRVCIGTACHVKGAPRLIESLHRLLSIPEGDDTDKDKQFTVEGVACLGCCTLAPVMLIDDVTYGHMSPDLMDKAVTDFIEHEDERAKQKKGSFLSMKGDDITEVRIGLGSCCIASGAGHVRDAVEMALSDNGATANVKRVGCVGMCHQTPLVEVVGDGKSHLYAKVQPEDASKIIERHFQASGFMNKFRRGLRKGLDHLLTDESWESVTRYSINVRDEPVDAFLSPQKHVALEHCGHIDPTDLDDFISRGGFEMARKVICDHSPEDTIDIITKSGLRGRGGAGFLTGMKWKFVRAAEGDEKYIILNGDEGDPGAFMDRMLLESYPFRILEGMMIASRAVGADKGVLYIREEYPLAVKRMQEAIDMCMEHGYLGDSMFDSDHSLHLRIMQGAGAFVCGEESALIASIEGKRGMPRMRPPYPANSGLWGKPTLVNNVETYSNVSWILRHGLGEYTDMGTEDSKGTKVFALAGKINRGGLIEVPMGISIGEIVDKIGGGVAEGRTFKAVQIGGPSGGCIPAELKDTPVDFQGLTERGAMMGSGGLVVLDSKDCIVDIAKYFLTFTQDQSCGRCTPCRIGTRRMLDILERLCRGEGREGDVELLEKLAYEIKQTALCGLGNTAPNPVLSTIRYFKDEYEAHIKGSCPAAKCEALIEYSINDNCTGCTLCARNCPVDAIQMKPFEKHEIDSDICIRCNACAEVCPEDAVDVE